MEEGLELDFLAVDCGEKSGDAIAFRYGNLDDVGKQMVVVIDGGTLESGKDLVTHIMEKYNTSFVDLVICTHPDADHASGLREVLNNCTVGELWIHLPWDHSEHVRHLFHDGRITDNSLNQRIRDEYNYAHELVEIAQSKKVRIREPFSGLSFDNGTIQVLGPTRDYYRSLLPSFARTPDAKENVLAAIRSFAAKTITWITERLDVETLDESGTTSAENLSSAVCLFKFREYYYLFTGDSGIESLKKVIAYAHSIGIDLRRLRFLQVPHHGSKRNVSPTVLNQIHAEIAYVSASKESIKHPAKKVLNALKRRGAKVYSTRGQSLMHSFNSRGRAGYGPVDPHPFYEQVEA